VNPVHLISSYIVGVVSVTVFVVFILLCREFVADFIESSDFISQDRKNNNVPLMLLKVSCSYVSCTHS
jgi:hypothetical protein